MGWCPFFRSSSRMACDTSPLNRIFTYLKGSLEDRDLLGSFCVSSDGFCLSSMLSSYFGILPAAGSCPSSPPPQLSSIVSLAATSLYLAIYFYLPLRFDGVAHLPSNRTSLSTQGEFLWSLPIFTEISFDILPVSLLQALATLMMAFAPGAPGSWWVGFRLISLSQFSLLMDRNIDVLLLCL